MKSYKPFFGILLTFGAAMVVFLVSPSRGYAQTKQDWSDPVNLSLSGSATNPSLVVDLTGTIHAIWVDTLDKGYKYSQSIDGKTWTPPQTASFPFSPKDQSPLLLAAADGSIDAFWISSDNVLFYGRATPANLVNLGNWKTASLSKDVLSFDVIVDARGALNLAYVTKSSSDNNPAGVYYEKSNNGGGFWSESIRLYASEYFRSAKESDTYIRISTSNFQDNEQIYVTWDDRAQKRVFMTVSGDSGLTWQKEQQIKGPSDTGGIDLPFNLTVAASNNQVLLVWQVGVPGSSACTVYSQWSVDGGKNWGETTAVLGGRSECPVGIKIVDRNNEYTTVMLIGQLKPMLLAWNGESWSDIQTQTQLPPISNPLTFDGVLLGCRFDLFYKQQLYVTGCDQDTGGDVWFLSRTLDPIESWFSSESSWSVANVPSVKSKDPKQIAQFSSVADGVGNIHVIWTESSIENVGAAKSAIEYARWDGQQWTNPDAIFKSLDDLPAQLSMMADPLGRLLVTWVDNSNGDLVFSWANLAKAGLSSEWANTVGLPSPSRLIASADSVVDGSGRIITTYAVPINEGRGIYVVQSTDNGNNWSAPVQAFDAVSAGWERIDQPRLSLGSDGTLHLIFMRQTSRIGQPVGLYYSRSVDGGATWSIPLALSKSDIQWADIVSYDGNTVHVVWQEYDGLVFANVSQVSQDGGATWGKQNDVSGVSNEATHVALASDGRGLLHFIQLMKRTDSSTINQENLILQDWKWDGNMWSPDLSNDVTINGRDVTYSLSANITSTGSLGIFIPAKYTDQVNGIKDELLFFYRQLDTTEIGQMPQAAIVPATTVEVSQTNIPNLQPTPAPTAVFSTLYGNNASSSLPRIIIGLVLTGVSVTILVILFIRRIPGNK